MFFGATRGHHHPAAGERPLRAGPIYISRRRHGPLTGVLWSRIRDVYFEKIRVFKAGNQKRLNTLAWNNGIGLWSYFVGSRTEVMINRDSWGHSYLIVRGEILGFMKDELLRKHLPRMFSLIKNES